MKIQYLVIQIMCCNIYLSQAQDICSTNNSPCTCQIVYNALSYIQMIKMDCSGQPILTEIPDIPSSTLILDFSNNRLNSNSIDGLCSFGYLEDVNLSNNQLTYIPPNSLDKCYIANSLNLSGNVFYIIETNSFKGLDETQAVYGLSSEKFTSDSLSGLQEVTTLELNILQMDMPETLFKNLKLQRLHLEFTEAVDIPESVFSPLSDTLQYLSIRAANIQSVPGNLFRDLRRLKSLEIIMPKLHHLPADIFQSNSSSLRSLHLNDINSLGQQTFANLTGLKILRINNVQNLPSELFKGLESLEILDLSNSEVRKLPTDFLKSLENLQSLSLRDAGLSNLTEPDLAGLESLRNIDLSHNQISELSTYLFYEIKRSVDAIDLSHNKIKTVPGNLFAKNTTLRKLDLNDNGISTIDIDAFSNLPDLEEIHLQNNRISKLPVNVFGNNLNLRYADFAMNKLEVFPDLIFANNKKLVRLNLMSNQINLTESPITTIMTSLMELNLNNNNVSCDCELVESVKNVKKARILGNCEMLDGTKRVILAHVKVSVDSCTLELKEKQISQTTITIDPVTNSTSTAPTTSTKTTVTTAPTTSTKTTVTTAPTTSTKTTVTIDPVTNSTSTAPTTSTQTTVTTAPTTSTKTIVTIDPVTNSTSTAPTTSTQTTVTTAPTTSTKTTVTIDPVTNSTSTAPTTSTQTTVTTAPTTSTMKTVTNDTVTNSTTTAPTTSTQTTVTIDPVTNSTSTPPTTSTKTTVTTDPVTNSTSIAPTTSTQISVTIDPVTKQTSTAPTTSTKTTVTTAPTTSAKTTVTTDPVTNSTSTAPTTSTQTTVTTAPTTSAKTTVTTDPVTNSTTLAPTTSTKTTVTIDPVTNSTSIAPTTSTKTTVTIYPVTNSTSIAPTTSTKTTVTIDPVTKSTSIAPTTSTDLTTSIPPHIKSTSPTITATSTKQTTEYRWRDGVKVTRNSTEVLVEVAEKQAEEQDVTEQPSEEVEVKEKLSEDAEVNETIETTLTENNATEKLAEQNLEISKTTFTLEPSETTPTIGGKIGGNFEDGPKTKIIMNTATEVITNATEAGSESSTDKLKPQKNTTHEKSKEIIDNDSKVVKTQPTILADPINPTDPSITLISPTGTISPNITNNGSDFVDEAVDGVNVTDNDDVDLDNNKTILSTTDGPGPRHRETSRQTLHFISIALMLTVVIVCIGVVLCAYKRRQQSDIYQVSRSLDLGKDLAMDGLKGDELGDFTDLSDMKGVPYVQVERVDELGIVHIETYPAPNGQIINTNLMEPHVKTEAAGEKHFEQDHEREIDVNNSTETNAEINGHMGDGNHCMKQSADIDLKP